MRVQAMMFRPALRSLAVALEGYSARMVFSVWSEWHRQFGPGPPAPAASKDPASSPAATASALPRVCRGVPTACWADAQGQSRSCSESTSSLRWACWLSQARAPPPLVLIGHAASLTPY